MELKEKVTSWISKYRYVALVLVIGVGLMLIPKGKTEESVQIPQSVQAAQQDITQELQNILSNIHGAGKVQVMLTQRAGQSTVYQTDDDENSSDTVIITGGDRGQQGLVQRVDPPRYQGAIVLCSGADNAAVRLGIIEAVSRVTGLGTDRICVLKIK